MLLLLALLAVVSQAGKVSIDWSRRTKRSVFAGIVETKSCEELYDLQSYPESSYHLDLIFWKPSERVRIARAARVVKKCMPHEIIPYLIISVVMLIAAIFFGFFSSVISNILYGLAGISSISSVGYYVIIGYLDYRNMFH